MKKIGRVAIYIFLWLVVPPTMFVLGLWWSWKDRKRDGK